MTFKTLKEAIAFAINREAEEMGFYETYARKTEKPATRTTFIQLAQEEKQHKELLEKITSKDLANPPSADKEIPDLGLAGLLRETQFSPDMEFPEALRFAIKREEESIKLYSTMLETAQTRELNNFFRHLVTQEKEHKNRLESEYDAIVLKDY